VNNIMADRTHISRPDLASATVVLNEAARTNSARPAGPVIGLAVSPGDLININVWTFYNSADFGTAPLDIVAAIATAFGGVSEGTGRGREDFHQRDQRLYRGIGFQYHFNSALCLPHVGGLRQKLQPLDLREQGRDHGQCTGATGIARNCH
jgi:hypothetical protein